MTDPLIGVRATTSLMTVGPVTVYRVTVYPVTIYPVTVSHALHEGRRGRGTRDRRVGASTSHRAAHRSGDG